MALFWIGSHYGALPHLTTDRKARTLLREELPTPLIYSLDPFSTNLGGAPQRYIHIGVHLEALGDKTLKELQDLKGSLRHSVIYILSELSFEELEGIQGKLRLKNQIIDQANALLQGAGVQNVYFSQLVVQ